MLPLICANTCSTRELVLDFSRLLAVGHEAGWGEAEEGPEAVAVGDLKAGGVIGEAVEALQHEHLELQHGVEARPAPQAPWLGG